MPDYVTAVTVQRALDTVLWTDSRFLFTYTQNAYKDEIGVGVWLDSEGVYHPTHILSAHGTLC